MTDDAERQQWRPSTLRRGPVGSSIVQGEDPATSRVTDRASVGGATAVGATAVPGPPPASAATEQDWLRGLEGRPRHAFHRMSRRPATGALRRGASRVGGIFTGDQVPTQLAAAWADIQTPVPTGRAVRVVGAHGGAGATATALCLASMLHRHRRDGVALIESGQGRGGLSGRLPHPPVSDLQTALRQLPAAADRASGLTVVAPGSADPQDAYRLATWLRRTHAVTVTDAGTHLGAHLDDVDCLVVVAQSTVRGVGAAQACRDQAVRAGTDVERVVVVVVDTVRKAGITIHQGLAHLRQNDVTAHPLPHDRHLAGAAQVHQELLAARTVLDIAQLAASVVGVSARPR